MNSNLIQENDPGKTYNKDAVTMKLSSDLKKFEKIKGSENRKVAIREMMDYLVEKKDYVHDHQRFSETVKNKLEEFAIAENFRLEYVYYELFGINLSSNEFLKEQRINNNYHQ